jgi:hypothetical protein
LSENAVRLLSCKRVAKSTRASHHSKLWVRELPEELQYTPAEEEAQFLGTFSCAAANEPEHLLEPHLFQIRARTASSLLISTEAAGQLRLAPFTRDHMLLLAGMTFG